MDQSTTPAIISAVSVLAGVIISQAISLFRSSLDKNHKKQILLRQKYEEMMFHFADSLQWLLDLNNMKTHAGILLLGHANSSRKVLSLCLLYFPDIAGISNEYIRAQMKYYEFVDVSFDKTNPHTAEIQALSHMEGKKLIRYLVKKKANLE